MSNLFPPHVIDDIRNRVPLSDVVGRAVTWDQKKSQPAKGDYWACCPFHAENSPSFHADNRRGGYHCFGCGAHGDIFTFLKESEGLGFREAVQQLAGEAGIGPGGLAPLSLEEEAKRKARADAERERQEQVQNKYREKERRKAFAIWQAGTSFSDTPAESYLAARAITPLSPRLPLRFHSALPYWHDRTRADGEKEMFVLHEGPALLVPITGPTGTFLGVHMTYIDVERPGEKMALVCPESGKKLPSKKVRGSHRCGAIRLVRRQAPTRLVIGEGIETVLSVYLAELYRSQDYRTQVVAQTDYWTSVNLQHLGGKHAETVKHPFLKTKAGRVAKVPGPGPDYSDTRALVIPDSIVEVITLMDGDSDPFTCRMVHRRAAARWAVPGRTIKASHPGDGIDFNDLLRHAPVTVKPLAHAETGDLACAG